MAKAIINGWGIWDIRDQQPKSGWLMRCINDECSQYEYFYRLAEAKATAQSTSCTECQQKGSGDNE